MLVVYYVDYGVTSIVVPTALRPYMGDLLELGMPSTHDVHFTSR